MGKIDSLVADENVRMPLERQQLADKEKTLEPWSHQVDLQADVVANREAELAAAKQRLRSREADLAADERRMRQREAEYSALDSYMLDHEYALANKEERLKLKMKQLRESLPDIERRERELAWKNAELQGLEEAYYDTLALR